MQVFFINSDTFLNDTGFLDEYLEGREFKCEKRRIEFGLGRFLLKYVLKTRFGVKNPQIILKNQKPALKNDEICFSLSHTKNIVLAAFDETPVGVDIEFMKERNFDLIYRYWKKSEKSVNKQEFYEQWTLYEAQIKLQQESKANFNAEIFENFMLGICSANSEPIEQRLEIWEIKSRPDKFELCRISTGAAQNTQTNW